MEDIKIKSLKEYSVRELYNINNRCKTAAHKCPQGVSSYRLLDDDEILLGRTTQDMLLDYWSKNNVLFNAGYYKYLDKETLRILKTHLIKKL